MKPRSFLLLIFLLALAFLSFGTASLVVTDPVESNYALTAKEMLSHGNWLSPEIYGSYWYDKPIFLYWLLELSYSLFGVTDFASRLPSVLFGAASCTLAAWFALRQGREKSTALLLAVMTATSLEFWLIARSVITDQMLFFFSGATLFLAYLGLTENRRTYVIAAYIMAAGAVLTKGPVGLVLPGLFLLLFALWQRNLRYFKALFPPLGILLFCLLCLSWYGPMYQLHGRDFINGLLGFNNVVRATVSEHPEYDVWYYYLLIVPAGLLPWSGVCLYGLWRQRGQELPHFLTVWSLGTVAFYTLMATKYPTYTYIANLPLLYLGAVTLKEMLQQGKIKPLLWLLLPAFFYWLLLAAPAFCSAKIPFAVSGLWQLSLFLLLALVLTLLALWQKALPALPLLVAAVTAVTCLFLTCQVLVPFYAYRSANVLSGENFSGQLYFFEEYRASYPYYTGTVPVWTAPDSYLEKVRRERSSLWNQKYRYPQASETQVLQQLQTGQKATFIVPRARYQDYLDSSFAAFTQEKKILGSYYIFSTP